MGNVVGWSGNKDGMELGQGGSELRAEWNESFRVYS